MKDFVAQVSNASSKKKKDRGTPVTFKHEGTDVTFYEPKTGQLSMMLAMFNKTKKAADEDDEKAFEENKRTISSFIQLFFGLMDKDTQSYFETRLLDGDDDFDVDSENGIMAIFKALSEEWGGRPTKSRSASAAPRRASGRSSTASTRAKG